MLIDSYPEGVEIKFLEREAVLEEIDNLPDYIFKSMFRLDRETFNEVLEAISPCMHTYQR